MKPRPCSLEKRKRIVSGKARLCLQSVQVISSDGQWHYFPTQKLNQTSKPLTSMTWRNGFRKRWCWLSRETSIVNKRLLAKCLPIHVLDSASFVPSISIFQSLHMTHLLTSQPLALLNKYLPLSETSVIKAGTGEPTGVGAVAFRRGACEYGREAPQESPVGSFPISPCSHTWLPGQMPAGCASGSRC